MLPDDCFDVKVEYEILEENYRMAKYQTHSVPNAKEIHYLQRHTFKDITEDTLLYMAESHICFKIYGFRKTKEVVRSFVLDDDPVK